MSHTLINCTCKNRLRFSLFSFTLIPQYLKGSIVLVGLASMISRSFQPLRRMREARKRGILVPRARRFLVTWSGRLQIKPSGSGDENGKRGNIYSVSVFFVRGGSQISPHRAKKDSNIPPPRENKISQMPYPGPTKTIKSSHHALVPPFPLPRLLYIDRCMKVHLRSIHVNFLKLIFMKRASVNVKLASETSLVIPKEVQHCLG